MNTNDHNSNGKHQPSENPPAADTTFSYRVSVEWGPAVEAHTMNRVGQIAHFVAERLATFHLEDADERPVPDLARITIERVLEPAKVADTPANPQ